MAQQDQEVMYYNNYLFLLLPMVLLLIVKFRLPRKHGGKNLPPGPWRLPVIGSLHHLVGALALPHRALRDLARAYDAPLMLLHLGELEVTVASSAGAASEIMKTHDAAFATRPRTATMRALTREGLGIAFAPHGEHWRQARKLSTTGLLGARQVRSQRGAREVETAALVATVASLSSASGPMNVSFLLSAYITDVVTRTVLGHPIGDLRDEFLERLDEGVKLVVGFSLADLFPSSRLARAFSGALRRAELLSREMSQLMDRITEEHRARRMSAGTRDEEEDLLDVLIRIQADGGIDGPLDNRTIRAIITDMFAAGSESTSTTIEWAMAELMRAPAALLRAQSEVRGTFAGESRVREEALPELHYLHLVIKETLRLHPVAPLLLPRECLEPRRVLGYDVPKGVMVLINAWAIGRDTASWGADAEEFRPERFEEAGAAAPDFRGTNFEFVPFGAGRRMCPGITFGLAVLELALASLLFHFDWELPAGSSGELDMAEAVGAAVRRMSDLRLHATVRVPVPAPTL
ncbi:zealexin A1 synthase-like [Triticum dicoccoides]|uniref:zealexin A1 synthase-like n=1 Tax=Triticum dicoccoides TaxID=85692 RepID=UPI0018913FFA|nr:zealexin A1 synthase-like [Triticum dicoccoides]